MPATEFAVPDAATENLLRLVAAYSQSAITMSFKTGDMKAVEFKGQDGGSLIGVNTAARFIAGSSPLATQLLGETPEDKAKVSEWLTFSLTELNPLLDDKLTKLNDWLLTRTFLVGNTTTLADLVIYAAVAPAASGFPVAQHSHFCNLLRWYDHIHAVADSANLFPAPKFQKAKFVAPPPPAPPAAKPAATNGKAAAAAAQSAEVNSAPAAATPAAEGKKSKKEKKGEEPATPATSTAPAPTSAKAAPAAADTAASGPAVDVLDLRVGLITKVGPHPNADSLYVEEIDLGEEAPRQVVSGLRNFVPEEGMLNRRVVVVCNLKPAKMRDVMSYGMVLCASNADHTSVDPIVPPEGVPVGERITFEGYNGEPEAQLNPKKKIFEKIAPDLITDADGVCTYKGVHFMTSKGPVRASMPGAHIA